LWKSYSCHGVDNRLAVAVHEDGNLIRRFFIVAKL
jgi:hypothetical protein